MLEITKPKSRISADECYLSIVIVTMCYRVFFSNLGTYDAPNTNRNERAAQSLIVIVASPPSNPDYERFHRAVNYYNERPPFNFPNPLPWPKSVSMTELLIYNKESQHFKTITAILRKK